MDGWFSTNLTNINTINSYFWLDRLWIILCWTWVIGMVSTPSNLLAWTMEHSMQLGDPLAWQQKLWTQQTHLESFANHNHQERIVYTHRSKCLPINENQMMHMWKGMLTPCIPGLIIQRRNFASTLQLCFVSYKA